MLKDYACYLITTLLVIGLILVAFAMSGCSEPTPAASSTPTPKKTTADDDAYTKYQRVVRQIKATYTDKRRIIHKVYEPRINDLKGVYGPNSTEAVDIIKERDKQLRTIRLEREQSLETEWLKFKAKALHGVVPAE